MTLEQSIEHWFAQGTAAVGNPDAFEAGTVRSACATYTYTNPSGDTLTIPTITPHPCH